MCEQKPSGGLKGAPAPLYLIRACLHGGGRPQVGEVKFGGSPHLSWKKRDQIKMRDYMDMRVTSPKRATSPIWGPPPPCKQALRPNRGPKGQKKLFCIPVRIFWSVLRYVFKHWARCWREILCFRRGTPPRAKSASSGPSFASFLPSRRHSTTSSSWIYENRTSGHLEATHLKLTQLK